MQVEEEGPSRGGLVALGAIVVGHHGIGLERLGKGPQQRIGIGEGAQRGELLLLKLVVCLAPRLPHLGALRLHVAPSQAVALGIGRFVSLQMRCKVLLDVCLGICRERERDECDDCRYS